MYNDSDYLMMSGIQHFCFCKRQWAIIHLEQQWNENVHTASGRIDHERCHDGSVREKRGDLLIVRGLQVSSTRLHLSGQCDVVEFHRNENGVPINMNEGLWRPYVVEYKHGKSKDIDADRLQLCAEVMALEEMLLCKIEKSALFYFGDRRREEVVISNELRETTQKMADEMWTYYCRGYTPKSKKRKACQSCSLRNLCLPFVTEKDDAKQYIDKVINE